MRSPRTLAVLTGLAALGCGGDGPAGPGDGNNNTNNTPTVHAVSIVSATGADNIMVGGNLQLTARVIGNNGEEMSGQTVSWTSSSASVATVTQAGLVTGHAPGTVQISGSSGGHAGQLSVTVWADPCTTAGNIAIGQTVNTTLTAIACRLSDGSYADRWRLQVGTQQRLRIDMMSTAFDTYLILHDSNGQVLAQDDDGGEGSNSRINREFAPGTYFILANSFAPAQGGTYSLSVAELPAGTCTKMSELTLGEAVTGALTTDDCTLSNGPFVDVWRIELKATTSVRFTMSSTAFDAYMLLVTSSGNVLAEDDNSLGNKNARIERTLAPGSYFIWATSANSGGTGSYQVSALPYSSLAVPQTVEPGQLKPAKPDAGH